MTPKEKAQELVEKYLISTPVPFHIEDAKKCALIASDEVMIYLDQIILPNPFKQYWNEVKKEIQKL